VFGSDQGLVGQFNEVVADRADGALPRAHVRQGHHPLVGTILVESETRRSQRDVTELHLFYNRPASGTAYAPVNV
jgi:F-type H+-transporting ATPase subunit gamma